MKIKHDVPVLLTQRQAWLIIEQMEKGAAAWEDAWACREATHVADKLRRMIALVNGKLKV